MKRAYILIIALLSISSANAQNLNTSNGGYESERIVEGKKFCVIYEEVEVNASIDDVWNEVAENFIHVDQIIKDVNFTECLSGDTTSGLGTKRMCNLNFQGDSIVIKEEIIDFRNCGDHREFTYFVYDSPDVPLKNYVTWVVRKGEDGKTYLGSVFIFRANASFLTGLVAKKLKKSGLRSGVLAYKHYLETGEKNVQTSKLIEMYPEED